MVYVNGEVTEHPLPMTVSELLAAIGAPPRGVAVAVNAEVVPRGEWPSVKLADEDRVEVLTAVQGG